MGEDLGRIIDMVRWMMYPLNSYAPSLKPIDMLPPIGKGILKVWLS